MGDAIRKDSNKVLIKIWFPQWSRLEEESWGGLIRHGLYSHVIMIVKQKLIVKY
jgi:hypothetical protein